MTVLGVTGEQDAVVIPFPQHRVRPLEEPREQQSEAPVVAFPHDRFQAPERSSVAAEEPPAEEAVTMTEDPSRLERRAHNVSLHALATRGQSLLEIELRMRSREIPEDVIAAEIERLEGSGLVDDDALAEELVDKYSHRGGLGRRAVADRLRQRKLSPEAIERALSVLSADDELEQLREVAQSRARSLTTLPADVAKRRLVAYLNRRGYSGSSVYEIVQDVLA
jgi:regulatory protein